MDRLKYLLIALLVFSACTKNDGPETLGPGEIWVSVEESDTDTKTSLSTSDGKTKFVSGDRIKVYDTDGYYAVYRFQTISGDKTKFLQVTKESQNEFKIAKFAAAFYPASAVTGFDKTNKKFTATISDEQTYATDSFSNGAAPMASNQYDSSEIKFKNCFGVIKLGFVYDDSSNPLTISSISLTGASKSLSGSFDFTITGTNVISVSSPSGADTVKLSGCETAGALGTTAKYFYVVVPGIPATSDGEKISVEITPTTGLPFGGYFMASKGTSNTTNEVKKNNILQLGDFNIVPVNPYSSYSVVEWQKDAMRVGQITVPESSYTIGTGTDSIDVQINGASDIDQLYATVQSGHFSAVTKQGDDSKYYVTISKATGWSEGESGVILVNDSVSNSGVYINVKII